MKSNISKHRRKLDEAKVLTDEEVIARLNGMNPPKTWDELLARFNWNLLQDAKFPRRKSKLWQ